MGSVQAFISPPSRILCVVSTQVWPPVLRPTKGSYPGSLRGIMAVVLGTALAGLKMLE